MSAWTYMREVFLKVFVVCVLSMALPLLLTFLQEDSVWRLMEVCAVSVICIICSILLFGTNHDERIIAWNFVQTKVLKR